MAATGSIIAELRREAGYTQKTLADALHITDKAVSKWERGICQPDSSLLPKLSLLLGADIELLLSNTAVHEDGWIGFLDLKEWDIDLSEKVYDKPMVYYFLSHFMLLNIREIYISTTEKNEEYLAQPIFEELGFTFIFDFTTLPKSNVMILNKPLFLFGSDLTRQFQAAMATKGLIKMVPINRNFTFLLCPSEFSFMYLKNPEYMAEAASERTEGRGVMCIDLSSLDGRLDAASFVKIYQTNTGLLIASLEEISYRKGIINQNEMMQIAQNAPYADRLRSITE